MYKPTLLIAALILGAHAHGQNTAKDVMKTVREYGAKIDWSKDPMKASADYSAYLKTTAVAAIKNLNNSEIAPADALDYGRLYEMAEDYKGVSAMAQKSLTTNLNQKDKFDAQLMLCRACAKLEDVPLLIKTVNEITPADFDQSRTYDQLTMMYFIPPIVKVAGLDTAMRVIDRCQKTVILADPAVEAAKEFPEYKAGTIKYAKPGTKLATDDEMLANLKKQFVTQNNSIPHGFASERAQLLMQAGRRKEALAVLDAYIKTDPKNERALKERTFMAISGAPAPDLNDMRHIGDFAGLASLKGKVVVVDFFAHWCIPCKHSFPEVRKMYDELKDKGLEVVSVTQFYGYYGQEQGLNKDAEYAKMQGFVKEFNMDWPVVIGSVANYQNYGITGVPTAILIGRDGKVIASEIGYMPNAFPAWRAKVEKALAQ